MDGGENNKRRKIDAFDIEFEDISSFTPDAGGDLKKTALIKKAEKISKLTGAHLTVGANAGAGNSYSYEFQSDIMLKCKIESWGVGSMLFADFLRDAKKYYKKTCLNAKYIYFFSYRPVYKEMTHGQLCWYLHWRSAVRDGQYIKTGLTYIFLYIYEQINLYNIIGVDKVYKNIVSVWKNYREEFRRIDKYIAEWLIDFSLIHNVKIDLDEIEDILPDLLNIVTLPEMYLHDKCYEEERYAKLLVKNISSYDYKKSKFYEANKDLFDAHILKMVHAVISGAEFAELIKKEILNGAKIKTTRESYSGAVCTSENKRKITIEYKNVYKSSFLKQYITDTVRLAENVLREHIGVKSRLLLPSSYPGELRRLIAEYQKKYLPSPKENDRKQKSKAAAKNKNAADYELPATEFNPDMAAASKIERRSWDTTIALVELQQRDNADNTADTVNTDVVKNADDKSNKNDMTGGENISEESKTDAPNANESSGMTAIDTNDTSFEDYGDFDEITASASLSAPAPAPAPETETETETEECPESGMSGLVASLTDIEIAALEKLCGDKAQNIDFEAVCAEFLREYNIMLETVTDGINEKSMNCIGDIIFDSSRGEIIEDYADELADGLNPALQKKKAKSSRNTGNTGNTGGK